MTSPVLLSWSGGKDSMMCLRWLRDRDVPVAALVTTVTEGGRMVSGQGVPEALLRAQAAALQLPLEVVAMPEAPSNEEYTARLGARLRALAESGATAVAFGDLFLADIREWREAFLREYGLEGRFPLWGADTAALLEEFLDVGYRAWITCVDTRAVAAEFAGRPLDAAAVSAMGEGVDPCGENGEFHSFVWDGPGFRRRVLCRPGPLRREGDSACRPPLAGAPGGGPEPPEL